jgi:hypothetical protein
MSDVSVLTLAVLQRFAEFLQELPDDQVADLAEGRARLSYIKWGDSEPVPPKVRRTAAKKAAPKVDPAAIVAALEQAGDRDAGRALLDPLTVGELRAVATGAGMTGISRTGKPDLIDQIVALTIGGRMSFAAMHTV